MNFFFSSWNSVKFVVLRMYYADPDPESACTPVYEMPFKFAVMRIRYSYYVDSAPGSINMRSIWTRNQEVKKQN